MYPGEAFEEEFWRATVSAGTALSMTDEVDAEEYNWYVENQVQQADFEDYAITNLEEADYGCFGDWSHWSAQQHG